MSDRHITKVLQAFLIGVYFDLVRVFFGVERDDGNAVLGDLIAVPLLSCDALKPLSLQAVACSLKVRRSGCWFRKGSEVITDTAGEKNQEDIEGVQVHF